MVQFSGFEVEFEDSEASALWDRNIHGGAPTDAAKSTTGRETRLPVQAWRPVIPADGWAAESRRLSSKLRVSSKFPQSTRKHSQSTAGALFCTHLGSKAEAQSALPDRGPHAAADSFAGIEGRSVYENPRDRSVFR